MHNRYNIILQEKYIQIQMEMIKKYAKSMKK
jgi:hypothetical protein